MNYVKSFNLFGVAATQIPCLLGAGAPTTSTKGAVGLLYMDTGTGEIYKCTAVRNGVYTWDVLGGSADGVLFTEQSLTEEQQAQARANIGITGTGIDGEDGEDGISPIITVSAISGGNRVKISDATGMKYFDVMDGATGRDGADGKDGSVGKDGIGIVSVTITEV